MKNKCNETGVDFGNTQNEPKSKFQPSANNTLADEQGCRKIRWADPVGSRKLVEELLEIVNSEAEYNILLRDIAEIDSILGLSSMKGGVQNC